MTLRMTRVEKIDEHFQELYQKYRGEGLDARHALEKARKQYPVRKDGKGRR